MKKNIENFELACILNGQEHILGGICSERTTWTSGQSSGTDTKYYDPTYGSSDPTIITDETNVSRVYDSPK
ncbi:MAG TPA: hypothetical protein PKY63_04715 [Bacteroidales bacterium]|nr:hypothetical protein [Bacteroidales bacterium]